MKTLFDHELAWHNPSIYKEIYQNSILYPKEFWEFHKVSLFRDSINNACYNCLDKHLQTHNSQKTAIIWHGDEIGDRREITYEDLYIMVANISSLLLEHKVTKGDVVTIYASTRPESIAAMLACARIGAIHNVVFAGFSPSVLKSRILSSKSKIIITNTYGHRGGKTINLLSNVEQVASELKNLKVIILDKISTNAPPKKIPECVQMNDTDDLFVLYTSGSTGQPKPIYHKIQGYLLYTTLTFKYIFDLKQNDIYFCTSDIGWITGHSYIVYAPLFHGITTVIFEGNPTYPTASRYWQIIQQERVSLFYTAPTAIRLLSMFNDSFLTSCDLSSLRILGSVGEPIDNDAWHWYFENIGKKKCPIMDTWWQTEIGGIAISPLHNIDSPKPCFASKPFFGIVPNINHEGALVLLNKTPVIWPHCTNELHTGDTAIQDSDKDIRIIGRMDEVINVTGHRLGTAEIENVVNSVEGVIESAVVGTNHEIKGQTAFIFVIKKNNHNNETIMHDIISTIRSKISPIAKPDYIAFVNELPKTRSGKIKRNILKNMVNGQTIDQTNIENLINPETIDNLQISIQTAIKCPDVCMIKA